MTDRTDENLELLDRESDRLIGTVEALSAGDRHAPTLSAGWDTAHLLTHVARNADALINLVRWAVDGQEREAYASAESRDRDIRDGAARPWSVIVDDLCVTAARFRAEAEQLRGPAGQAQVRSRTGTPITGAQVISMRVLEVVFHHVDLDRGYTFEHCDQGVVTRSLRRGVRQWAGRRGPVPDLTVLPEGMDPLQLGAGGPEVSGTPGQLLLWVARGQVRGLHSDVDLPTPPPWA